MIGNFFVLYDEAAEEKEAEGGDDNDDPYGRRLGRGGSVLGRGAADNKWR